MLAKRVRGEKGRKKELAMFSIGVTVSATYFRLAGMNKGVYFSCSASNALPLYSVANPQAQG